MPSGGGLKCILALMIIAQTDIGNVPADFVKYFIMMAGFVATGWVAFRKGKEASGTKDEPLNVAQPLEVKKTTEYAARHDVEKLKTSIEEILKAGEDRQLRIIAAVHDAEKRQLAEIKDIHERLNPVAENGKAHGLMLESLSKRHDAAEAERRADVRLMQQRIDDMIRLSSHTKKS